MTNSEVPTQVPVVGTQSTNQTIGFALDVAYLPLERVEVPLTLVRREWAVQAVRIMVDGERESPSRSIAIESGAETIQAQNLEGPPRGDYLYRWSNPPGGIYFVGSDRTRHFPYKGESTYLDPWPDPPPPGRFLFGASLFGWVVLLAGGIGHMVRKGPAINGAGCIIPCSAGRGRGCRGTKKLPTYCRRGKSLGLCFSKSLTVSPSLGVSTPFGSLLG